MSEGLSRDALIEKVAGTIDEQYDDYLPRYNAEGVCVSSGLAAAAVDAVLSAVADDLEGNAELLRFAWRQTAFADLASEREKKATVQQWIDAADRVRGLLGKDTIN